MLFKSVTFCNCIKRVIWEVHSRSSDNLVEKARCHLVHKCDCATQSCTQVAKAPLKISWLPTPSLHHQLHVSFGATKTQVKPQLLDQQHTSSQASGHALDALGSSWRAELSSEV